MLPETDLEAFRAAITAAFPELAGAGFRLLTKGWDSIAVDVDDRLIFKFPRHEQAAHALTKEARLLSIVRNAVDMQVPEIALHTGPPLFSRHVKLRGDHLVTAEYRRLPEDARRDLAERMARFYAQLHALDPTVVAAAGAGPVEAWRGAEEIRDRALPALPPDLRAYAERTLAAWRDLPPDPCGTTYGFFDGHGWNMAFDHARNRLTGLYDFADSGFGALHQEFIYSNFIATDLTERIVGRYEVLTGRTLDRRRIALLTAVHRLSELAELADERGQVPAAVEHVAAWAAEERSSK